MKKRPQLTRRQLLNFTGVTGAAFLARHPLGALLDQMVHGFIHRAIAEESGSTAAPRNYLFLCLEGGPGRWQFDQILKSSDSSPFLDNLSVRTALVPSGDGSIDGSIYKVHKSSRGGKELHLPWVWHSMVPSSSGGMRPMEDLLSNMMFIRGIDLVNDGHYANRVLQHRPNQSSPSLGGLVADMAHTPIPAITVNGIAGFQSKLGIAEVNVNPAGNALQNLLGPFTAGRAGTYREQNAIRAEVDRAASVLQEYSMSSLPGAESLYRARKDAEDLFMRELGNLEAIWPTLYGKYFGLVVRAFMDRSVAGISDRPIYRKDNVYNPAQLAVFNGPGTYVPPEGRDLRDIFQSDSQVFKLAQSFAIAEFALTRGLSSSIQLTGGDMVGLHAEAPGEPVQPLACLMDQHGLGTIAATYINSQLARGLSACLLELIDAMRATSNGNGGNLFDESVIHIASEFARSARIDGTGSDHGINGNVVSLLSGAIQGAHLTGNIRTTISADPNYPYYGTWGFGGGMETFQNRRLNIGNVGSTIAELLRVESPTPNDASLLIPAGSKFTALDEAKNVES